MKESPKYVATLLAFLAGSFVLSWCAVYSFWIAAHVFRSVEAVRTGDSIAGVILFPARTFLRSTGLNLELTNPVLAAAINAALLGILLYACFRRLIFGKKPGGG